MAEKTKQLLTHQAAARVASAVRRGQPDVERQARRDLIMTKAYAKIREGQALLASLYDETEDGA